MQDAGYHGIGGVGGPRPGFPMIRMQPRPGLRPPGSVPNQPNALRLQLQHRLQAQQVKDADGHKSACHYVILISKNS